MNEPLIPALFDIAWSGVVVIAFVGLVVALVQIRRTPSLSSTARAIWVLIVLFAPIAGPAVWFIIGRRPLPA
jgi:hypothetical protein